MGQSGFTRWLLYSFIALETTKRNESLGIPVLECIGTRRARTSLPFSRIAAKKKPLKSELNISIINRQSCLWREKSRLNEIDR